MNIQYVFGVAGQGDQGLSPHKLLNQSQIYTILSIVDQLLKYIVDPSQKRKMDANPNLEELERDGDFLQFKQGCFFENVYNYILLNSRPDVQYTNELKRQIMKYADQKEKENQKERETDFNQLFSTINIWIEDQKLRSSQTKSQNSDGQSSSIGYFPSASLTYLLARLRQHKLQLYVSNIKSDKESTRTMHQQFVDTVNRVALQLIINEIVKEQENKQSESLKTLIQKLKELVELVQLEQIKFANLISLNNYQYQRFNLPLATLKAQIQESMNFISPTYLNITVENLVKMFNKCFTLDLKESDPMRILTQQIGDQIQAEEIEDAKTLKMNL